MSYTTESLVCPNILNSSRGLPSLGYLCFLPLALPEVRATHQHTGPKIVMMCVLVLPCSAEIYFTLASKSLTTLQKLQK